MGNFLLHAWFVAAVILLVGVNAVSKALSLVRRLNIQIQLLPCRLLVLPRDTRVRVIDDGSGTPPLEGACHVLGRGRDRQPAALRADNTSIRVPFVLLGEEYCPRLGCVLTELSVYSQHGRVYR